ncbi:MAG: cytochrome-c oxidase, cbb3-type subunit III [Hyphomicrobiaceae bacterium]|nr:cytochrome-c oxidase, cbb3-type subunit III [Hyphomicrobiaceae bacterium]
MAGHKEIDEATGVETTGHVWDGDLRELNKPLPKWWLYTFYVCIVWAIGYWVLYPTWPTANGYTKGMLGYSQRATVTEEVKAGKAAQSGLRDRLQKTALADVRKNPELLQFAVAGGKAAFADNCAPCHGRGAQGGNGYPNLNDDDWIWGGQVDAIQQTIQHGIRWQGAADTRESAMPRFGLDEILEPAQIGDVADYVLSLSGGKADAAAVERGKATYAEQCSACHGEDGKGNAELGAPNLTDAIWLYGSDRATVMESIRTGRGGAMPAWAGRLDPVTIKSLAVYVHSLGGGK